MTYGNPSTNVFTITTPGNKTWRITGSGNVISAIRRPSAISDTTTIAASNGVVTSVVRDGVATSYNRSVSGNTATVVVTDAQQHATTIVYDLPTFRPLTVTDPLSRSTTFGYDPVGRLKEVTDPEGDKLQYTYDARGNVTETPQDKQPVCPAPSASTAPASRRHSSPNWTRPGWQVLYKTFAGYRSLSRSGYGHNDASDAWRHFRWSFSMAQTMGDTAARDFLEHHERAEPNPPGEAHMDATNNAMGLAFANDPRYADMDPDVAANVALKRGCLQTGTK